jgi:hypothetical protein
MDMDGGTIKRGKNGLKRALQLVQHSTASMGRYVTKVSCSAPLQRCSNSRFSVWVTDLTRGAPESRQ